MLIGELPEDTTVSDDGFLLYSEDGVHALKIKKKHVITSGVTAKYGLTDPEDQPGLTPKDGDIYFKLNGETLDQATNIIDIFIYVENEWKGSSFAKAGAVGWEPVLTSGETIAAITVDGVRYPIYAPAGGTEIAIGDLLYTGVNIATITLDGNVYVIKAPEPEGVTDVTLQYVDNGQVVTESLVDETDGTAKLNLDPDSMYYTANGATINMKNLGYRSDITNVDFATDNQGTQLTFPSEGRWHVTIGVRLNLNASYTSNDPSEHLYLKLLSNAFEGGSLEERVPICLYNGETLSTQTIVCSGVAVVDSNNNSMMVHIGGNLKNALTASSLSVYVKGFKLGR